MARGRPKVVGEHLRNGPDPKFRVSGKPRRPKGMGKDAAWLWKEITDSLPPESLGSIDTVALRAACKLWERWLQYCDSDAPQKYYISLSALKQLNQILSCYGWTPKDRKQLRQPPKEETQQHDRFFGVKAS